MRSRSLGTGTAGVGMEPGGHVGKLEARRLLGLLKYTYGFVGRYCWMFWFLILQMLTYQVLAYSLKYLINDLIPQKRVDRLLLFLAAWVGAFAVHGVFTLLAARQRIEIVQTLVARIRAEIIRKMQVLSIKYFDTRGTGANSARLLMDVDKTEQFYNWMMVNFLQAVLGIVLMIPILSTIDLPLTAITVLYVPAIPLVQRLFRKVLVSRAHLLRDTNARLSEKLVDFISGLKEIRVSATEDVQSRRILGEVDSVREAGIQYTMSMRVLSMIIQFFSDFMPTLLWVTAGILMIRRPGLNIGEVVAYIAIVRHMVNEVRMLFSSFDQIVAATPSVVAISEILESTEVENQHPTVTEFQIDGSVEAKGVTFRYQSRGERRQLHNVNLSVRPGERVALVGESGSGKTTLINVMLGLYPVESGEIYFGELPLTDIKLRTLRSQIAIMSQDTFLFNTTILENVRFADLDADRERITEACRKAELLDFVESLPLGLDTQVGERGVMLSGGQRQRIGMARVFLRDPRIVILDEPSSALDVLTEQRLFDTLYRNIGDRTLIVVAHRLSTIRKVDRVFVFRDGTIVEEGRFDELLNDRGHFARMVDANLAGVHLPRG